MAKVRAKTLTCPSCGSAVPVRNVFKAKLVVCPNCDSQLDLSSPGFEALGKLPRREEPQDALCLGLKGELPDGRRHEIIGRIRFSESDEEEIWFWDEWLLLTQNGEYLWLSEEGRQFELHTPFIPQNPPPLDVLRSARTLEVDGTSYRVKERGRPSISYVEGELTWRATVGDRVSYVDARGPGGGFGVEFNDEEIEFFKRRRLSRHEVYQYMGLQKLLDLEDERDALRRKYQAGPKSMTTGGVMFAAAAVFGFFIFVVGAGLGSRPMRGSLATVETATLESGAELARGDLKKGTEYALYFDATAYPALSKANVSLIDPAGKSHLLVQATNLQKTGPIDTSVEFTAEADGTHVLHLQGTRNATATSVPISSATGTTTTGSKALGNVAWRLQSHPINLTGFFCVAPFLLLGAIVLFLTGAGRMASASARAAREYREMRQAIIERLRHESRIQE